MVGNINRPVSCGVGTAFLAGGLALTIVGAIFMLTSVQSQTLGFNRFNNGFILLTIGLSLLLVVVNIYFYILQGKKKDNLEEVKQ